MTRESKPRKRGVGDKIELQEWFREYKSGCSCTNCKEDHPACIEFHHTRDKEFGIAAGISRGYSKEKILKEIEKCITLCSNCHRKLHHNNREIDEYESQMLIDCTKVINSRD